MYLKYLIQRKIKDKYTEGSFVIGMDQNVVNENQEE